MKIAQFRKGPNDRKKYTVEYNDWLDVGETIIAPLLVTGTVEADAFIVDGYVISSDGKDVIFYVSGGLSGFSYDVTVKITTSQAQIKEDWVTFKVI